MPALVSSMPMPSFAGWHPYMLCLLLAKCFCNFDKTALRSLLRNSAAETTDSLEITTSVMVESDAYLLDRRQRISTVSLMSKIRHKHDY